MIGPIFFTAIPLRTVLNFRDYVRIEETFHTWFEKSSAQQSTDGTFISSVFSFSSSSILFFIGVLVFQRKLRPFSLSVGRVMVSENLVSFIFY